MPGPEAARLFESLRRIADSGVGGAVRLPSPRRGLAGCRPGNRAARRTSSRHRRRQRSHPRPARRADARTRALGRRHSARPQPRRPKHRSAAPGQRATWGDGGRHRPRGTRRRGTRHRGPDRIWPRGSRRAARRSTPPRGDRQGGRSHAAAGPAFGGDLRRSVLRPGGSSPPGAAADRQCAREHDRCRSVQVLATRLPAAHVRSGAKSSTGSTS